MSPLRLEGRPFCWPLWQCGLTEVTFNLTGVGVSASLQYQYQISKPVAWLRGPDISQNNQKSYAAVNRTARNIPNCGPSWVVKIQGGGGNAPSALPDINVPDVCMF